MGIVNKQYFLVMDYHVGVKKWGAYYKYRRMRNCSWSTVEGIEMGQNHLVQQTPSPTYSKAYKIYVKLWKKEK